MKRSFIYLFMTALLLAMPCESHAQRFLDKLKQKAENKILNAMGLGEEEQAPEKEIVMEEPEQSYQQPASATDKIPKLRQSSVVWDGQATPSKAADYKALLNELPPLPSVEEMANPTPSAREAYYNKLYSLSLRAEELDDMYTCSDEEMVVARDKLYKEMEGITGLTADEMVRLDDENTSQAERERLEQKMMDHVLGGADVGGMEAAAAKNEARLEEDFIRKSTFLVYNSEENCYYKLNNGVRTRLEGNGPFDYHVPQKRDDSAYGEISLRGGGRKAVYDRSGSLILHDGTYCYPIAMQRNGDWLDFIMSNGSTFEVCSYRL